MDFPVVERLIDAINAHDLDALTATFADDFTSTWPAHPARSFSSPQQVRRNWATVFTQFPEIRVSVTGSAGSADEFWGEFHYARPCAADLRGVTSWPAGPVSPRSTSDAWNRAAAGRRRTSSTHRRRPCG
ncbi:nuclear transport factor 2 family protein [Actinoplanes sp. NPDC048791]|uniref:nuclear transport factor 2 family protein n=1 Tax=Actinoplanes sp. NPDC048791 TaxID=3154623 RepID=UPI003408C4B6